MERVSVSQLKDQLSAYLKKVRSGQTVVVTDRNQPVAQLTPISNQESEDERVARLVAQGILRLPKGPPLDMQDFLKRRPVVKNAGVLEALLEERRQGR
ncbi:MAG: type II toxin-antitoxin system prevent-host-death family antitoxin [Pseudomonadota bacterium]|nr:type II toxin-antitoxin system prevent-host-death family antitoxin [Pseudomonadota bacterium]